ncbi:hypothetical protein BDZ45DRAFT_809444 [Acephala macrosclerotiorum]|nr:hypothetical protein BDZ45DRAFT_809444 [Acephala macrosclerotiorum]
MSESNFSTKTDKSTASKWLSHSDRSLLSILNGYFEDKELLPPSNFYRFYWFCCHHSKGELASAPKLLFIDRTYATSGPTHKTNLTGRIMFTEDGYMNVLIKDIAPFNFDRAHAPDSQVAALAKTVTTYCGMYTVHNDSGRIYTRTKLDVALSPFWMLQDQIRIRYL